MSFDVRRLPLQAPRVQLERMPVRRPPASHDLVVAVVSLVAAAGLLLVLL